jgi:hypothetical protein
VFPVANDEDAEMNFLYLQREINILKYYALSWLPACALLTHDTRHTNTHTHDTRHDTRTYLYAAGECDTRASCSSLASRTITPTTLFTSSLRSLRHCHALP